MAKGSPALRLANRARTAQSPNRLGTDRARTSVFVFPSLARDARKRPTRPPSRDAPPDPHFTTPSHASEFGFKPKIGADRNATTNGDPASPKRAPHASTTRRDAAAAAASDFEIRENARLALELKQEELEKLKRRLSATEDALRRREDRNAELETRLSEHEGNKVAAEAEALNSSLAAAMRDVRGFFSSGGKVDAAKTPSFNGNGEAFATFDATSPRKDSGVLRSGLKKKASRADPGEPASGAKKIGVTFVSQSEQKRLEEEGGYVAKLSAKTAENETLVSRLLATETSLERKREQMRVAKEAYQALQKRLEEETRRREEAEKMVKRKAAANASSSSDRRHATVPDTVPETQTEREKRESTEALLCDVLSVTAHACGVSGRADSFAVTSALPALAALAKAGPGEVALELLTETLVVEHITRVFDMHEDDATAAASVCSTLAALVAGARAAGGGGGAARRQEVLESAAPTLARVVSRALAKHRSSPEACACACDLLHALARSDFSFVHEKKTTRRRSVTSELVRAGCAAGATDAAEWHPSDEDVVSSAARAIVCMVENASSIDSASIARCGAASVVLRAERYGIDTGIKRAGREVEAWARESAAARVDEKNTLTFSAAAPSTTPRRRAAIPEEAAYEGSGFKPRVPVSLNRRGSNRGVRDANGDANGDATGWDRTWDGTAAEEDDFDDAQFDDKL